MPFSLGPFEFAIILIIFFIFFGAGKLGQLGGALGRGFKEFKKGAGFDDDSKKVAAPPDRPGPTS
jgi:sec-independent protein translocase protein TatA